MTLQRTRKGEFLLPGKISLRCSLNYVTVLSSMSFTVGDMLVILLVVFVYGPGSNLNVLVFIYV